MTRKLVVKRLSASDLTLFKTHFDKTAGTKQKAINLDIDPFVTVLYPSLPDVAKEMPRGAIPLDLSIYGPGLAGQHNVARKILKQKKNWRLNGEYISDPDDQAGRYDALKKADYAIFDFYGDIVPQTVRIYFIAGNDPEDAGLHAGIKDVTDMQLSNHKSMLVLDVGMVESITLSVPIDSSHPVLDLFEEADLEDAAQGGTSGIQRLVKRRSGRPVTQEELQRAKKNAERIGRLGEELVNGWLENRLSRGDVGEFIWDADENAVSAYDFSLTVAGQQRLVDVKSTSGPHSNRLHVSMAELIKMRESDGPYDLYRLSDVTEYGAKCRIASDVKDTAAAILATLEKLPVGVTADSVATNPEIWNFSSIDVYISVPEEEENSEEA